MMIINPNYNFPSATGQRGIIEINAFVAAAAFGVGRALIRFRSRSSQFACILRPAYTSELGGADEEGKQIGRIAAQEVNKNERPTSDHCRRRLLRSAFYLIN